MSVLNVGEAVPVRMVALIRYLLLCPDMSDSRRRLELMLSPPNVRSKSEGDMVRKVVNEGVKLGLLTESGDKKDSVLVLSEDARAAYPAGIFGDIQTRLLLTRLLVKSAENRDLCHLLAWFLSQDAKTVRGTHTDLKKLYNEQIGSTQVSFNDVAYGDLRYWSIFLGFAWSHKIGGIGEEIVPDPTRHIEWLLPFLFSNSKMQDEPLPRWIERLAELCPVMPGGTFHNAIKGLPPMSHVLPALAFALLRLRDRGVLELSNKSDAEGLVVMDNGRPTRLTHIKWAQQHSVRRAS